MTNEFVISNELLWRLVRTIDQGVFSVIVDAVN